MIIFKGQSNFISGFIWIVTNIITKTFINGGTVSFRVKAFNLSQIFDFFCKILSVTNFSPISLSKMSQKNRNRSKYLCTWLLILPDSLRGSRDFAFSHEFLTDLGLSRISPGFLKDNPENNFTQDIQEYLWVLEWNVFSEADLRLLQHPRWSVLW